MNYFNDNHGKEGADSSHILLHKLIKEEILSTQESNTQDLNSLIQSAINKMNEKEPVLYGIKFINIKIIQKVFLKSTFLLILGLKTIDSTSILMTPELNADLTVRYLYNMNLNIQNIENYFNYQMHGERLLSSILSNKQDLVELKIKGNL